MPGKAHPYARQDISFAGIATSLGLRDFWPGSSKLPAVAQLLTNTLQYRPESFCPLIVEVVQKGLVYRSNKNPPINREEIERMNRLVAELGFKIPELWDPKFLGGLPKAKNQEPQAQASVPAKTALEDLKKRLLTLTSLSPQQRGFDFERFLNEVFAIFRLAPKGSFRLMGEQIDGSLQFQGETYLVEAKWENRQIPEAELLSFAGKVAGKAKWSRGLLISYSGFSKDGLEAFSRGKPTQIICMDGLDLHYVLEMTLDLGKVLERKARRAAETNEAFVPVRDLFDNLS